LDGNHTSFDLSKIEDDNSLEYRQLTGDIDKVAGYLKLLQSKGIPVLWRPLHEAAGNRYAGGDAWFWWGAYGAESFKELWRLMYDRFVNMHGLTNLIWIWTYEPAGYAEWYPGDEYVDLVGSDIYGEGDVSRISDRYRSMRENFINKPSVLSECGSVSLISEQWASGARWLYFMPWYDYGRTNDITAAAFRETSHEHANISWWLDAFNCEFVLSRDELPNLK
jgi:mannan endo-1,4-beta-mannosidase